MNSLYKSLDGQLHSEPHWSFVNSYGMSKCFFFPFIKKPFRLIQPTTVQRFFVFLSVYRLGRIYPETSLHEHIL